MDMLNRIRFVDDPGFTASGKRVLVRVDFNVPLAEGKVTSDKRIRASLPTIELLLNRGAKVILMSHLGRPEGERVEAMSLKPVAQRLAELLDQPVAWADDCIGDEVVAATKSMKDASVLMLENLRFHRAETKDGAAFGAQLAQNGDLYVNDAFGTCHRAHGSVTGVAAHLDRYGGLLVKKEVTYFAKLMDNPQQPYVAILGGAKVADKIAVIAALLERADRLIIGGGMAYTFLKAQGQEIGTSLLDQDHLAFAASMLEKAKALGVEIVLPVDHVVAASIDAAQGQSVTTIPPDMAAFDVGPATLDLFERALAGAKTIVFNGPVGVFEKSPFSGGTRGLLDLLARRKDAGAVVVVGGGDSAAATEKLGYATRVSHISTGGGASLELLEGKELPGLVALAR